MSSQSYLFNPTERTLAAAGDGFSCPRLTTAGRTALALTAGDKGMMVYDTALTDLCIWNGAAWEFVSDNSNGFISVKDFGAKGDNSTIDTTSIQAAFNAANAAGGGTVYFPGGTYLIDNPIIVYSNTVVFMAGTVKVSVMPIGGYETAFITNPVSPANNIEFINPQIDGNNVVPTSGIMIRYGATNVRVEGGYIRNCANSSSVPGGRAFNIEGGTGTQNITISGTNVTGCWNGVSVAGGAAQANSNVSISNLTISNCQVAISLFGNTAGYPHTGEFMQAAFSNLSIRNCGHLTTFTTQAGIICSDRGSNFSFSNVYVFNDSGYGAVGSFWRGDANNISMDNVTVETDLTVGLFDFSSYAESNAYPLAANSSLNSRFINVKNTGTIPNIVVLPILGAAYLTNCQFDVFTNIVSSGSPINAGLNNKTTVYIKAQNKANNCILQGYCSDIFQFDNNFSSWTNGEMNFSLSGAAKAWALINGATGAVNRAFGITCVRSSAGSYAITLTRPLPSSQYVVIVDSEPNSTASVQANIVSSKNGFGFNLSTYSGGVLADKPLINIAVFF
jgi:hypothetical protein